MAKINDKSWREQTVENVGMGNIKTVYFDDTKPNYILLSNPGPLPLYVSTNPNVSNVDADMVIPAYGRQLFAQAFGVKELFFVCYDGEIHNVRLKSWEGEFDPVSINQTMQTVPQAEDLNLGNVIVTNFPSNVEINNDLGNPVPVSGNVGINNFPATQPVSGTVGVNNFPETQPVSGTVGVNNFPETQAVAGTVTIGNDTAAPVPTINADYLTKLDTIITLLTQIELNTQPV